MGIGMALFGNVVGGPSWPHIIVVTTIDNILRPFPGAPRCLP